MKTLRQFSIFAITIIIAITTFSCNDDDKNETPDPADKTALKTEITKANDLLGQSTQGNNPGQYPEEAMKAFTNAINAAKTIYDDDKATQQTIDAAVSTLSTAIETFKATQIAVAGVDKSILETALTEASGLYTSAVVGFGQGEYSQAAKDIFEAAIDAATQVKNNDNATQQDVDAAVTTLNEAKTTFTSSTNIQDYDQYLSLHLKMDGNIQDASYYKHVGTLNVRTGSSIPQLTTDRFGQANKAYAFNGNNISIPNHSTLTPANVSVSIWIKPASITGSQAIYSMNWWDGYYLKTEGAQLLFASTGAGGAYIGTWGQIEVGSWYHVVVTRSNSVFNIYVNGVLDNTTEIATNTGMIIGDTQPFIIGALSYENDEYPFNGSIDEVRVYSKALTEAEITALYNKEKP